ncbi:MAG TPA: PIG-L family deacetylase [Galbitalea sp.]|jgi:N-acetyl-1-D-myo-inositol-2-amino-2-deoxy-alpha-D-glucopyranoside deacetylase
MTDPERVLFVHAHPDDETIDTGGTIATLVDRGAVVTVLTCTRGERGEVIAEDLQYAVHNPDTLASVRELELRKAVGILGVGDHRFLGDANARWGGRVPRRYSDSGMQWEKPGVAVATSEFDPASLTSADFGDVAADIAAVILDVQPGAIVSYDSRGGYGHPDHVRAAQAARRAAEVYGVPFFEIVPGRDGGSIVVDVSAALDRKRSALEAYRTQVVVDGDDFELSNHESRPIDTLERYRRAAVSDADRIDFRDTHWASKIIVAIVAIVIGAATGALFSVYCLTTLTVAGQPIWIGCILGAALSVALLTGMRLAFGTRTVAFWCAAGLVAIVAILSFQSAGGTILVPTLGADGSISGQGILWAATPALAAIVVLAWPRSRGRATGRLIRPAVTKGP